VDFVCSSQVLHEGARSTWGSIKPQLPMFLTSWVDKTSASCMYTMTQTRTWSALHLKEGCWYIECGKTICPVEEEDEKATCDKAETRGVKLVSDVVVVPEELTLADLALLPEKERNKILNQRARDAKKAERESTRATAKALKEGPAEKGVKKGEKPGKSKVITSQLLLTETSTAMPSQNPRKRDSSLAQLSVSRLQQLASPSLMDSVRGDLHVQEFFFSGSLLSTDAYYMEHDAFPKEWVDMKAFLKTICHFYCHLNAL
jgi:hypothetical protein